MTNPIVSVIMPVYNGEPYIRKAVESVAAQDLPLELILIDDGSGDGSLKVINECQRDFPNLAIRVLQNAENLGVAQSRNRGVQEARGAYVAFLDCDDWWAPGKLKAQIERMKKTGRAVSCTAREFALADGSLTGRVVPVEPVIKREDLLHFNSIALSSAVLKTAVAREFPMGNDDCHEDYLMWLEILQKYGEADGINQPLLKYRKSPAAKTRSKLKSAYMHYQSLRRAGVGGLKACGLFVRYAINGVKNHGGVK